MTGEVFEPGVIFQAISTCVGIHRAHSFLQGRNGVGRIMFYRAGQDEWWEAHCENLPELVISLSTGTVTVE